MNPRAKGYRNEMKAQKILEAAGYLVIKKVHTKYSPGDFFEIYDLIAHNEDGWRCVQVKTNRRETPELREKIEMFPVSPGTTREVWVFYDRVSEPVIHVI